MVLGDKQSFDNDKNRARKMTRTCVPYDYYNYLIDFYFRISIVMNMPVKGNLLKFCKIGHIFFTVQWTPFNDKTFTLINI